MSRNLKTNIFQLFVGFLAIFMLPQMVFAAEMFFEQEKNFGLKDQFRMGVFLETEEPLNAIEGKISFPTDFLELKSVEDGNSIVNLWLERPATGKTGEIVFSGITPGGYKGKGPIFSMVFGVKREGVGTLDIHDARVLRNDGSGTGAELQTFSSKFVISKKTTAVQIPIPISKIEDADLPESFMPEIAKDETLFDERWFVVFATQDKASGIDYYAIHESRRIRTRIATNKWVMAESPYVLKDQELRSYIYVKAVDKAGNERIIKLAPRKPLAWYENYENWIMIIVVIIFTYIFIKRNLWKKLLTH